MRQFLIIIVVLALGGGAAYYLLQPAAGPAGGGMPAGFAIPVDVADVVAQPLQITLDSVGTILSDESVIIRPEMGGTIAAIHFTEGSLVAKNDLLITLDDRMVRAEYQQAAASAGAARLAALRADQLIGLGAISKSEHEQAQSQARALQAGENLAKTKLEKMTLRAPFSGVIGLRHVSVGDVVQPGQDIANFEAAQDMKIDFTVPEISAPLVTVGQEIYVSLAALPEQKYRGEIFAIDPKIDEQGRNVRVRARVANEDGRLRAGGYARVSLVLGQKDAALMIPEAALMPQGNDQFVFVVGADKKVAMEKIVIGQRQNGMVEVVTGLNVGQRVVTAGQLKLQPGAPVMLPEDMAAMMQGQKDGGKPQ